MQRVVYFSGDAGATSSCAARGCPGALPDAVARFVPSMLGARTGEDRVVKTGALCGNGAQSIALHGAGVITGTVDAGVDAEPSDASPGD